MIAASGETLTKAQRRIVVYLDGAHSLCHQASIGISRFIAERWDWSVRWCPSDSSPLFAADGTPNDGAIIVCNDPDAAARFSTQCERFVLAGCQPENREQTAVFCEPGSVGRLAARHLCELGHQSLACVSFNIAMDHDQVHGFAEVARADEATVTAWQVPHSESAGKEERDSTFAEWLAALPRPTGLFVTDDRFAANICELAREMAIGVPDDLAVIAAAHDPNAAALSRPTLSFVEYPWQEVGYQAAALLADLLEGESSGRQVVISPHNVVHCRSTFTLAVEDDKVPRGGRLHP